MKMLATGAAVLAAVIVLSSTYIVDQSENAVIVQLGSPVGEVVTAPGLHWKLPFIQEARRTDNRTLVWDGDVTQVPTRGREFVLVDATARWKIVEPLTFIRAVRDEQGARTRLDDIIDSATRDVITETQLEEIVRSADWNVDPAQLEPGEADSVDASLGKPGKGRAQLESEIFAEAKKLTPTLGIELIDVRLKRVNYVDSVRQQVESRMIAERQAIAERFRSEGKGKREEILGEMDRKLKTITSEAGRSAQEIIGTADAEATKIYGRAFGADPEFYAFFRTLESYSAVGANTTLMVDANSDFYRYLQTARRQ